MIDDVPRAKAALPRPVGQRYRPLADLRLKDLLVDLPPRSLSHSSKEANFCKAARIVALSVDDRHLPWGRA